MLASMKVAAGLRTAASRFDGSSGGKGVGGGEAAMLQKLKEKEN
jgi:hypothetical protein